MARLFWETIELVTIPGRVTVTSLRGVVRWSRIDGDGIEGSFRSGRVQLGQELEPGVQLTLLKASSLTLASLGEKSIVVEQKGRESRTCSLTVTESDSFGTGFEEQAKGFDVLAKAPAVVQRAAFEKMIERLPAERIREMCQTAPSRLLDREVALRLRVLPLLETPIGLVVASVDWTALKAAAAIRACRLPIMLATGHRSTIASMLKKVYGRRRIPG